MEHEFAFDVKLWAAVRIKARTKREAVEALTAILDAASPSDGFVEGFNSAAQGCRITEVSICPESEADLEPFEIDGEEVEQ